MGREESSLGGGGGIQVGRETSGRGGEGVREEGKMGRAEGEED